MTVLAVTGGTGFVGQHLIRLAVERGDSVRALTRRPQPERQGIRWVQGALDDAAALDRLCDGAEAVIHVAGVVNAPDRAGFASGNIAGTQAVVDSAKAAGVARFVHVSSLAAREPSLSAYGWSKAESETIVRRSGLDWTIVRPPAVYGPGDREMLELFRMARLGLVLLPPGGRLSIIEVTDLARLLLALPRARDTIGAVYEPDDGVARGWDHRELAAMLGEAVGRRTRSLSVPARVLALISRLEAAVRPRTAKLSADRVRYFCHPDWTVSIGAAPSPSLWQPRVETRSGLAATARWYRAEGWLAR